MSYREAFERRLRTDASGPLITWYDLATAARVELSATTFGNWVDKTGHLLTEEIDPEPGDPVAMPLLGSRPGHWMSLVLVAAAWHLGAGVTVDAGAGVRLVVGGPDVAADPSGTPTWAVSLHPLGLGAGSVADGVLDWADEARGYPDLHLPAADVPDELAWADPATTFAELGGSGVADETPRRRLVRPDEPWSTVRAGLVTPILTGGSVVLVEGPATDDQLRTIAADERCDA